jgi:LmbE family N-acetylglucosaminyl deacetylase
MEFVRNELRVARTGVRALVIAAHPDDIDAGTLAYLRRSLGIETHVCLCTRGEGSENLAGPEDGAQLAVLRTKETEAACRVLCAKAWYLNLPDFGSSRSVEETLKIWDHDKALAQMVCVIRLVRPHILLMDDAAPADGHHRAAAQLAQEAFEAAADPNKFAERMKQDGTQAWSAFKLYARVPESRETAISFSLTERGLNADSTPAEVAAVARNRQFSLGPQPQRKLGEPELRHFVLVKSRQPQKKEASLLDGLLSHDIKPLDNLIDVAAVAKLASMQAPAAVQSSEEDIRPHRDEAIAEVLGIRTQITVGDAVTTQDEPVSVTVRVANGNSRPLRASVSLWAESPHWEIKSDGASKELALNATAEFQATITAKARAYPTFPAEDYIFSRTDAQPPVRATIRLEIPDGKGCIQATMRRLVPLELALPREVRIAPDPVLIFDDPSHGETFLALARFRMVVTNRRKLAQPLRLFGGIQPKDSAPVDRWATFVFHDEDEVLSDEFRFMAPVEKLGKGDLEVQTAVWNADTNFGGPVARLRRIPLKLPEKLSVALVKTDDALLSALKNIELACPGFSVTPLAPDDLRTANLNAFHTIILDSRATHLRPELRHSRERLMEFMNDGGNILCLHQRDAEWNAADGALAPFPIALSASRVTDETAPVRMLNPEHPLLSEPCKIWERDFQGWAVERGVSFPEKWAPQYVPLLSTNDPGENPLDGGLLVADVGRGSFIYTSFNWSRQLRAGVPGAYRLLANMLSYPRVKK